MSRPRTWRESIKIGKLRKKLFKQSDGLCFYCKCKMTLEGDRFAPDAMTLDHLLPRGKGGEDTEENCVVCCRRCNILRGDEDIKKFVAKYFPWKLYPKTGS